MLEEKINTFFLEYESRFNVALNGGELDTTGIQDSFAKHYIEASPEGINPGVNDFLFRLSIPRGYRQYRKLGMRSIKATHKEITAIDSYHYMVKVNWSAWYMIEDEKSKTVDGDEQKVLKENGIIS